MREARAAISKLTAERLNPASFCTRSGCCGWARLAQEASDAGYRDYRDRYRTMATDLVEGHVSASAMA